MADSNNPGQFGNRKDTEEQARKGGEQSGGQFKKGSQRAKQAGQKGGSAS